MKILVLFAVFFSFVFGEEQEKKFQNKVVLLPPVVLALTPILPPKEIRNTLRDFHAIYREDLREILFPEKIEDFWWVLVILRPENLKEKKPKLWCIEINAAKEEKNSRHFFITRIPLSEKFSVISAARQAAEKTKERILSRPLRANLRNQTGNLATFKTPRAMHRGSFFNLTFPCWLCASV